MLWYLRMAGFDQGDNAFQVLWLAHFLFSKRSPFDEPHDKDAVGVIDNFGGDTGGISCARGRNLIKSHNSMNRGWSSADPDNEALAAVDDD